MFATSLPPEGSVDDIPINLFPFAIFSEIIVISINDNSGPSN